MTTQIENRTSAVEFATETRVHVAINVASVEKSLPFYKVLFGGDPAKVRPGYAKFEVANPPVNFTLNENPALVTNPNGALSHLGIQVKSTADVLAAKTRFIEAGLATFDEENVTCCYAVQDKIWVHDPDGNEWEFFVVTAADSDVHSIKADSEAACCTPLPERQEIMKQDATATCCETDCCATNETVARQPLELVR
jgi:catechol 2,3-dioxygenase-like lactoylglutathione lyase family enzyme